MPLACSYLPAEVVGDALELAIDARLLDMRASPYDLRFAPEQVRMRERATGETQGVLDAWV